MNNANRQDDRSLAAGSNGRYVEHYDPTMNSAGRYFAWSAWRQRLIFMSLAPSLVVVGWSVYLASMLAEPGPSPPFIPVLVAAVVVVPISSFLLVRLLDAFQMARTPGACGQHPRVTFRSLFGVQYIQILKSMWLQCQT